MLDGVKFGEEVVGLVRGFVEREFGPLKAANEALAARVEELEARPAPEKGDPGEPGQDATVPSLEAVWSEMRPQAEELIREAVEAAVAALPPPERGEPGQPGKDFDPDAMKQAVEEAVVQAVAAIPAPEPGKDGRGVKELLIDRDGNLVATMDDGEMKSLGPVVGRDGEPGDPGRDGFSLEDFDIEPGDDGRTYTLKFERGDTKHAYELSFPCPVYCGVWKEAETYSPGDLVTFGGSTWHCNRFEPGKPDTKDCGWQLMVKRGRDGKDAPRG